MFSKTLLSLLRVCFLTDVEGDIHYFNRFMHISKILCWRDKITHSTVHIPESMLNVNVLQKYEIDFQGEFVSRMHSSVAPWHPEKCLQANTNAKTFEEMLKVNTDTEFVDHEYNENKITTTRERVNLCDSNKLEECEHNNTTEDVTHFVYGGDAFDHGDDLTFARLLLDFKARYPDRVHLMLGNRDLNKLVLGPLIQCVSNLTPEEAQHRAFPLTRLTGSLHPQIISYREFLHRRYNKEWHKKEEKKEYSKSKEANGSDDDSKSKVVKFFDKNMESVMPDKISFLQWALKYKMGCTDTFEHRRNELAALAHTTHCKHNFSDNSDSDIITDEEVAESFFAAIKPGGVYYEYMHQGELIIKLSSLLFVHGGINEINLRFVPLLHARRRERWHHLNNNNICNTLNKTRQDTSSSALHDKEQKTHTKHNHKTEVEELEVIASEEEIVLANNANGSRVYGKQLPSEEINDWINALHQFKEDSLTEWEDAMNEWKQQNDECSIYSSTDEINNNCNHYYTTSFVGGEVLRQYCYPRLWAPHSVVVNSFIGLHGPQYATLPVVSYLLQNGVQVVCSGHQPCGDSPTLLFQPPHGSFVLIDGDNSYCSRGTDPSSSTKLTYNINHEEIAHNKKHEEQKCYHSYHHENSVNSKENENNQIQEITENLTCKQTDISDKKSNKAYITSTSVKEPFSENKEQIKSVIQINRRGAAVQEIIFEVEDMEEEETDIKDRNKMSETYHDDNIYHSEVTSNKITYNGDNDDENDEDEGNHCLERNEENRDSGSKLRVWVHGKRSDGRCFAFDASPATCFSALTYSSVQTKQNRKEEYKNKNYLGRRMKDGWWVKIPLSQCDYDAWQIEHQQQQKQQNKQHLEEESSLQDISSGKNSNANYDKWRNSMQETDKSSECNMKEDNVSLTRLAHNKENLAELIQRIQSTEVVGYELHKTSNAFRSEEVKIVTVSDLQKMLLEQQKEEQQIQRQQECQQTEKYDGCFSVGGELVSRWSTEELAYKEIHRLKTKVTPTNV